MVSIAGRAGTDESIGGKEESIDGNDESTGGNEVSMAGKVESISGSGVSKAGIDSGGALVVSVVVAGKFSDLVDGCCVDSPGGWADSVISVMANSCLLSRT